MAEYNLGNVKGQQGEKGEKGEKGIGISNISYTESFVSGGENKIKLTFTDGTESEEFSVKNGKDGVDGVDGVDGKTGLRGTVKIGTVTKGSEASIENVGTDNDAILNFVLPKGDAGNPVDMETLETLEELSGSDYIMIQREDTVYKTTLSNLATFLNSLN